MQQHDSNLRSSVREHFTDNHFTAPKDTSVSTPNRPAPTHGFQVLGRFFARVDWGLVFRTTCKLFGLVGIAILTYILKVYAEIAPDLVSLLPSIGQYLTAVFFLWMLLITPERLQGFNFLFLSGLFGIVAIF